MPNHFNISPLLAVPQIVGDAVGWGFVVRGSKPCHIQAVDPGGPAAAAGMKVRTEERKSPKKHCELQKEKKMLPCGEYIISSILCTVLFI